MKDAYQISLLSDNSRGIRIQVGHILLDDGQRILINNFQVFIHLFSETYHYPSYPAQKNMRKGYKTRWRRVMIRSAI